MELLYNLYIPMLASPLPMYGIDGIAHQYLGCPTWRSNISDHVLSVFVYLWPNPTPLCLPLVFREWAFPYPPSCGVTTFRVPQNILNPMLSLPSSTMAMLDSPWAISNRPGSQLLLALAKWPVKGPFRGLPSSKNPKRIGWFPTSNRNFCLVLRCFEYSSVYTCNNYWSMLHQL